MSMSPRLLRPRQTLHPEAASWASRVAANSGTVSGTTLSAVDKFCKSITSAGIRDRFLRLNLFCGTGLNAALVPLYRAASLGDTQLGNATDTNNGPFVGVGTDYTETGASGGLTGNGTNKYLATGLAHNNIAQNTGHISCYEVSRGTNTFRISAGVRSGNFAGYLALGTWASTSNYTVLAYESASNLGLASSVGGHYVGNVTGSAASALYRNGGSKVTTSAVTRTVGPEQFVIFGLNDSGTPLAFTNARLGGYSIGQTFASDADVLAFSDAMNAFQIALGRNV